MGAIIFLPRALRCSLSTNPFEAALGLHSMVARTLARACANSRSLCVGISDHRPGERGDAQTVVENCGNSLILRCSASEGGGTAQFASQFIGERELLRRHVSRIDAPASPAMPRPPRIQVGIRLDSHRTPLNDRDAPHLTDAHRAEHIASLGPKQRIYRRHLPMPARYLSARENLILNFFHSNA